MKRLVKHLLLSIGAMFIALPIHAQVEAPQANAHMKDSRLETDAAKQVGKLGISFMEYMKISSTLEKPIYDCYAAEVKNRPKAQGVADVVVDLNTDGAVTNAYVTNVYGLSRDLKNCTREAARSWKFGPLKTSVRQLTVSLRYVHIPTASRASSALNTPRLLLNNQELDVTKGMDKMAVRQVVRDNRNAFLYCLSENQLKDATPKVTVEILSTGAAKDAKVESNNDGLSACIKAKVEAIRFPAFEPTKSKQTLNWSFRMRLFDPKALTPTF